MTDTIEYKNHTIHIEPMQDVWESPRDWDNCSTMALFLRGYDSLNESEYDADTIDDYINGRDSESGQFIESPFAWIPVAAYIHSGITIFEGYKGNCMWDSGFAGYMYMTREQAKNAGIKTKEHAERILRADLETMDNYLTGNVYSYYIEGPHCDDSCCGFYGYDHEKSGLLSESKGSIDYAIKHAKKQKTEKLKTLIKQAVPLNVRPSILATI